MIFPRTLAVTNKLIQDIEKMLFKTTIVVQCIFFVYYGYSIYTNLVNISFLITYSLLLVISTLSFIHYLSNYRSKVKNNSKSVKRTFRVFKYLVNGSMLAMNTVELIRYGGTEVAYALIVFSTLSLVFQIVVEFFRIYTSLYIELFTIAVDKDTAFLKKVADANILSLVDAPLEMIANRLESNTVELTKNEKYVDSLMKEQREKDSVRKKEKKQANSRRQKDDIKEHFNIIKNRIFKKKEK